MARPGRKKTNIGPCSEDGCEKDSHTRGYCAAHYQSPSKRIGEFSNDGAPRFWWSRRAITGLAPISFAHGVANGVIVIDGGGACGCAASTQTMKGDS